MGTPGLVGPISTQVNPYIGPLALTMIFKGWMQRDASNIYEKLVFLPKIGCLDNISRK